MILIAVGVRNLSQKLLTGIPLAMFLIVIHIGSVAYYREYSEGIDYQDLAQQVANRSQEGDLFFVHNRSWATTPIFYYLDKRSHQLVAENFDDAVNQNSNARIWVIYPEWLPPSREMQEALARFHLQDQVVSLGIVGLLYVRTPSS